MLRELAGFVVISLGLLSCGCAGSGPRAGGAPASQPARSLLSFTTASGDFVLVPAGLDERAEAIDLVVHFHGATETVQREFLATGASAVLVVVNYRGLSAAYEKPLGDPARFAAILDEPLLELRRRERVAAQAVWRRVCLTSFSAGYGAIRAILRQPGAAERIDAIYLADSLYAGYVERDGARNVNLDHIDVFLSFAAEAAAGRKWMFVTHSYLEPGTYAGTHETADALVARAGATRRPVEEVVPDARQVEPRPLRVVSKAELGRLAIWGCAGTTGENHMGHLRNLRVGLARLPLRR